MTSRLEKRMDQIAAVVAPRPSRRFLAFARAVMAFGGHSGADEAAESFARWLESGGWRREE